MSTASGSLPWLVTIVTASESEPASSMTGGLVMVFVILSLPFEPAVRPLAKLFANAVRPDLPANRFCMSTKSCADDAASG